MDIKLVAIDMDGTLLDPSLQITQHTINQLNDMMERQIEVVVCTGRTISELPEEMKQMPAIKYIITANGGVIWDRHALKIIYENQIPHDKAMEIIEILQPYDMRIEAFAMGRVFIEQNCYDHFKDYGGENFEDFLLNSRTPIDSMYEFIKAYDKPIDKFNLFFKTVEERKAAWDTCVANGFTVTSSFEQNMEVNAATANKGMALKALASHLDIEQQHVMAIGDQLNDMSMLSYAGFPVAMGNAITPVKNIASYITKPNSEDGVAYAIQHLLIEGDL
ncbi:HAD family hydrolase [Kurthia sibirica]|uniref:HAD family hydrolase n=1 Tax=Kurthia sibirica TaxID=202750 RepID=UPI001174C841|nr:HAD family hydrolase [Kurthia sibirica]GEK34582.1 phosphatase YwpJ [Kurthia sibirica]